MQMASEPSGSGLIKPSSRGEYTSAQEVWAGPSRAGFQGVSFPGRGEIKDTGVEHA